MIPNTMQADGILREESGWIMSRHNLSITVIATPAIRYFRVSRQECFTVMTM